MSSFLMWSNLVFPLAHLNILISAEFSLFSCFFFTAQHSESYVIAGADDRTCHARTKDYDNNYRNYEEIQQGDDKLNTVTTFKYLGPIGLNLLG